MSDATCHKIAQKLADYFEGDWINFDPCVDCPANEYGCDHDNRKCPLAKEYRDTQKKIALGKYPHGS